MVEIIARPGAEIELGRPGENLAYCVMFDISEWQRVYGSGTVHLLHQRPEDDAPYPCSIKVENGWVRWEIKNTDVASAGRGEAELQYYVESTVAKSQTYHTRVFRALDETGATPGEPEKTWVEQVLFAAAQVNIATKDAEEIAANSQKVSDNMEIAVAAAQAAETAKAAAVSAQQATEQAASNAESRLQDYVNAANQAKTDAQTAADNAATKAAQGVEGKLAGYVTDAENAKNDAQSAAGTAATKAAQGVEDKLAGYVTDAENAKNDAQSAAGTAAEDAVSAVDTKMADYVSAAQAAKTAAEQARNDAAAYAGTASASATNASRSEQSADTSAQNAAKSESNAAGSATNAATSETNAGESATNAAKSETNAKTSETAAKTSETNAKTSESNAKISEGNAKTSETNAANSKTAAQTAQQAAEQEKIAAQTAASDAKQSAGSAESAAAAASTSAGNASQSEQASSASAAAAKQSETNAKASEDAAKISETNAAASASAAETSKSSAAKSASDAASSYLSAKSCKDAAGTSELNAKASEDAAKDAQAAIEGMTVTAETLEVGAEATVTKEVTDGVVNLHFGLPRGSGGSGGAANWSQNDETQPDYVKNRTHWKVVNETEIIPETEVTFKTTLSTASGIADGLVEGKTYLVEWNGVGYEAVAWTSEFNSVCVGDDPDSIGTNYPFCIEGGGGTYYYITKETSTSETITIRMAETETEIHQLSEEYLPDGVPYRVKTDKKTIVFPLTSVGSKFQNFSSTLKFYAGNFYSVAWDGVDYECEAKESVVNGVESVVFGAINGTGEPFTVVLYSQKVDGRYGYIESVDGTAGHTASISLIEMKVRKLHKDCLPDDFTGGGTLDVEVAGGTEAIAALAESGIITPVYQSGTFYTDADGKIYVY